jgi:sulfite exporter TauE/SafE
MCGGVVGMLTAGLEPQVRANPKKVALFHLNYNVGRILSYILMGAIFGLVGALLTQSLQMNILDQGLRIFSGVLMIMVGMYIGNWSTSIQVFERMGAKFWTKLQPLTQKFLPIQNLRGAFFTGLLWGGIPCGLVYGALSFAIVSGSVAKGGMIMLAFGLGTLPSLLLMASLSSQLSVVAQKPIIRKFSGLLIMALGVSALWMPLNSIINAKPHGHTNTLQPQTDMHKLHNQTITPRSSDFDYLT